MTDQPIRLDLKELGTTGLSYFYKWLDEAHTAELKWPDCVPLYNRLWRSDPEVAIVRNILSSWASGLTISAELPTDLETEIEEELDDDDKLARDYLSTILLDIEHGFQSWLIDCMTKVPLYGWGWWETVLGIRNPEWTPPQGDPWRSQYDDNLIGIRRLAQRRYSSFFGWEFSEQTQGRHLTGMEQFDRYGGEEPVVIPLDRSVHIVYGDLGSPEGLGTMEALWRLERIKYGLEIVQGIGFEHSAGHLSVTVDESGEFDSTNIQKVARNILTAQPGNYAAWPKGVNGEFVDAPFSTAATILEAIRYYGILKLSLFGMQFVALSATTGAGSYASMSDSSTIAMTIFNSMTQSFIQQINDQLVKRIFSYDIVKSAFPNMTRLPQITVSEVRKPVELDKFAKFISSIAEVLHLNSDDINAIRKETGILPQVSTSELEEQMDNEEKEPSPSPSEEEESEEPSTPEEAEDAELSNYPSVQKAYEYVTWTPDEIQRLSDLPPDDSVLDYAVNAEVRDGSE